MVQTSEVRDGHDAANRLNCTRLVCAPDGGQIAGWELTGAAGLSEDESHGQSTAPTAARLP